MRSLGNFPDPFIAEILGQPDAIRRAAAALGGQADALGRVLDAAAERRSYVFSGMGSSLHASAPAVTELCGRGVQAQLVDAAELLHFRQPILSSETVLVLVSQSGESAEVVRLAADVRARPDRPVIVAVTNGLSNALVGHADVAVDTRAGEELGPSTMTFAASLVVMSALTRVLARMDVSSAIARAAAAAEHAGAAIGDLLVDPDAFASGLVAGLGDASAIVVVGRGSATAAAEMAALLLKETGTFAEALTSAAFRHGPFELAGPELGVAVVATEERTRALDLGLAADLVDTGASVLVIAPEGDVPAGALDVRIRYDERLLSPAVAVVPLQLLAWRLTAARGRRPGEFTRATKVTTRE